LKTTGQPAFSEILAAAMFAADKHACQRRKGDLQEPYINHLLEVAHLIATHTDPPDQTAIIAGLLHDTVEDTNTTVEELEERFGAEVAGLVLEVTDDKTLPKQERKALQIRNAPKKSARAQVIKLADKISNLRSILETPPANWSYQRKREYFDWAKQVIDGLGDPNPRLKAEFDRIYSLFDERVCP
jgi:guanosine-3',5'-bis(diphosphate) 3'-pyrophosphohydrolase